MTTLDLKAVYDFLNLKAVSDFLNVKAVYDFFFIRFQRAAELPS